MIPDERDRLEADLRTAVRRLRERREQVSRQRVDELLDHYLEVTAPAAPMMSAGRSRRPDTHRRNDR